jgi:hypothetical protein
VFFETVGIFPRMDKIGAFFMEKVAVVLYYFMGVSQGWYLTACIKIILSSRFSPITIL